MGFFDEGGAFGDAFDGIFGSADAGGGGANMPIPQDPTGGLANDAGINDIGANLAPPVDTVSGPPAGQNMVPQAANVPMPQARPAGAISAEAGGTPFDAGQPQTPGAAPPLSAPQGIPTSTGPTPPPGAPPPNTYGEYVPPPPAAANAGGGNRGGLLDPFMRAIGKNPDTPFGSGLFGDPRTARQMMGGIGAGLKSVGDNWNKPGLAAFAGSAGSAMEGGQKADDTGTEQQRKDTQQAIDKAKLDETKRRNDQMFQAAEDRLKKAQQVGTVASRAQAWENSDLGRLQKANSEILKRQQEIRQSYRDDLRAAANSGQNGNDIRTQMKKEMDEAEAGVYKQYGIDPKNINKIQSMGTSSDNPHKPTSWDEFHSTVKPGQFFVNPADGKTYQRKSEAPPPIDMGGGTLTAQPSFMSPDSGYGYTGYPNAA